MEVAEAICACTSRCTSTQAGIWRRAGDAEAPGLLRKAAAAAPPRSLAPSTTLPHRLVYGDRDVQATLNRLASCMSLPDLMRQMTGVGMPQPPQARRLAALDSAVS